MSEVIFRRAVTRLRFELQLALWHWLLLTSDVGLQIWHISPYGATSQLSGLFRVFPRVGYGSADMDEHRQHNT
jgi:uncharacterized membrane protein YwaF